MILVSGISNSGKSHMLASLARAAPAFRCLSTSGILRSIDRPLRPLTPSQAEDNQWALLKELRRSGATASPWTLLDGHVLIETDQHLMPIPASWYDAASFAGFAHVEADPSDIAERRASKGLPWSAPEAASYQARGREEARRQAERQEKPFTVVPSGDFDALAAWAASVVNNSGQGA